MKEIEVKAQVIDLEALKRKLLAQGCTLSEPKIQKDWIFLSDSIEYEDIKRGTVVLRIRDSNGKYILTLKKRLENELATIEKEVQIDDSIQAKEILEYMGFHEVVRVSKSRQACELDGLTICLDEVDELGAFIEVEKMTEEDDSLAVQEELLKFLEGLGVNREQRIQKGYDTLMYELKAKA